MQLVEVLLCCVTSMPMPTFFCLAGFTMYGTLYRFWTWSFWEPSPLLFGRQYSMALSNKFGWSEGRKWSLVWKQLEKVGKRHFGCMLKSRSTWRNLKLVLSYKNHPFPYEFFTSSFAGALLFETYILEKRHGDSDLVKYYDSPRCNYHEPRHQERVPCFDDQLMSANLPQRSNVDPNWPQYGES